MLTRWGGALCVDVFCRSAVCPSSDIYMDGLWRSQRLEVSADRFYYANKYVRSAYRCIIGMVALGRCPVAAARLRAGLIGAAWTLGKPNIRSSCSISCGQRDNSVILRGPSVPHRRWSANEHKADQVDGAGPADRCR
jgi:hypothetical protein